MKELKTGFIAPAIDENHFVLGGLSNDVIKIDGNWFKYLPPAESQLEKTFDSDGCTVYGTLNAIETLDYFLTGTQRNYSDRALYNAVGIVPPGSDPHLVATTIRGVGLVLEEFLSDMVDSLAVFMTPRPLTQDLKVKGLEWFRRWQLGHEWVITSSTKDKDKVRILKEALLRGTVCISVTAWFQDDKGLYYSPQGIANSHWTMCYNIDDTGIYVFDSYPDAMTGSYLKKLSLDHNISYAKRYSLVPQLATIGEELTWLEKLVKILSDLLKGNESKLPPIKEVYPNPLMPPKLEKFCEAIKLHEGFWKGTRSERNNNPGNTKYSPVGYLPQYGIVRVDEQGFAVFSSYKIGMEYLQNLVLKKSKSHPNWDFFDFFKNYAPASDNNDPKRYAEVVAFACGVPPTSKVHATLTT